MDDNKWLLATLAAALCWSVADILCDMCIGEDDDDEEDGFEMTKLSEAAQDEERATSPRERDRERDGDWKGDDGDPRRKWSIGSADKAADTLFRRVRPGVENEVEALHGTKENKASEMEARSDHDEEEEEEEHLDGVQDCAIAGLTTMIVMYGLALKRVQTQGGRTPTAEIGSAFHSESPLIKFLWSPSDDIEWWMATMSGSLMFIHYLYLLMAFDSAPSTVINPLIQVSSTWMLFGSAIPALLTGSTFIRPMDFLCYVIIVVGGILPSLDGNFRRMLTLNFWTQKFVRNTVISEVAVGIYDLTMSYCLQTSGKKEKFLEISPAEIEFEFFFIAWCGFVVSFCLTFAFLPFFRQRFLDLRNIPRKILILSAFGQSLTLLGYYASQFAYSWYYQASIVHAAEASLSQGFNLLFAFIALKVFGIGRESAIDNLKIKILSCIIVTVGLFLLSYSESEEIEETAPPIQITKLLDDLDLDSQLDLGILPGRLLV